MTMESMRSVPDSDGERSAALETASRLDGRQTIMTPERTELAVVLREQGTASTP